MIFYDKICSCNWILSFLLMNLVLDFEFCQKWISSSWKTCRWLSSLHLDLKWFLRVWEWNQWWWCEMKSEIQLSIAKLHMTHVSQSGNVGIWGSEWYTASNTERDFKCIDQQQYCCRLNENQHDSDHHVSFQRPSSLESLKHKVIVMYQQDWDSRLDFHS